MPTYAPTDGFLRVGADVEDPGLKVTDGLLVVFAPRTGALAPIRRSGTVTTVAAVAGDEALADELALVTVTVVDGVLTLVGEAAVPAPSESPLICPAPPHPGLICPPRLRVSPVAGARVTVARVGVARPSPAPVPCDTHVDTREDAGGEQPVRARRLRLDS